MVVKITPPPSPNPKCSKGSQDEVLKNPLKLLSVVFINHPHPSPFSRSPPAASSSCCAALRPSLANEHTKNSLSEDGLNPSMHSSKRNKEATHFLNYFKDNISRVLSYTCSNNKVFIS